MKIKNYLITCAAISVAVSLTILYVPGVSDAVEGAMLAFLAANAR